MLIDVRYKADLKRLVSLEEMKVMPELADMRVLQRGNRLSITPVSKAEFQAVVAAARKRS